MRTTDDDEASDDRIELGHDPKRRTASRRVFARATTIRHRLGSWFVPAFALLVVVAIGATALVVDMARGPNKDEAAPASVGHDTDPTAPASTAMGAATGAQDEPADPLEGITLGPPPRVPYYSGGVLRWTDGQFLTDRREINVLVSRGGTSLLLTSSQRLVMFEGSILRPVGTDVSSGPAISADGRLAAWANAKGTSGRLVLWDVRARHAAAVQPIELGFPCCDHPGVQVVGIDRAGRVYITAGGRFLLWTPAKETLDLLRNVSPYSSLATVIPQGPVFVKSVAIGRQPPMIYGDVSAGGRFDPMDRQRGTDAAWSPFGDIIGYLSSPTSAVARPLGGIATALDTPPTMRIQDLTWESASVLLVVVTADDGRASWLRCDVGTGECELAADLGESGRFKKTWAISTNDPLSYL